MSALRPLLNPGLYAGLLVTAMLVVVAYQVRPTYDFAIGTATDGPLLRGFNTAEVIQGSPPIPFRWTTGDSSIILRDVGSQDFRVGITINGWRPEGQPRPDLTIDAGNQQVLHVTPTPAPADYSFDVPRELVNDGTLALHIRTNAFIPPNDPNPRPLGVGVIRVRVTPGSGADRFIEPPTDILFSLIAASALLGLLLSVLGWGPGGVAVGGSLVGALASALLLFNRLWLTMGAWYREWPQILLVGGIFTVVLWLAGGWLLKIGRAPWSARQRRGLLTLVLATFLVRLLGQLHPEIFIVDLGFHIHRLETVDSGQLLFTIQSAEWGGHSTFYLPTAYVLMLPLQGLFTDKAFVIDLFTVLIGTLGAIPIFYIANRAALDSRTGVAAAALYLTLPIAVLPYSWGITTNVFGEFFALCALAIALGAYPTLQPRRLALYALLAALFVALLSHPGVVQLVGAAFVFISLLWLISGRTIGPRVGAIWTLGALLAAAGLAYVLYYGHFAADMLNTLREIQAERAAQTVPGQLHLKVGGSVADSSLGLVVRYVSTRKDWLVGGLQGFWNEAVAYYRVWPIVGAALAYTCLLPSSRHARTALDRERARLLLAAVGWALAVVLFAIIGWVFNLYVRYALFALPIVALGAGLLLTRVSRRARGGGLLSLLVLILFAAQALALWNYRIDYAFK